VNKFVSRFACCSHSLTNMLFVGPILLSLVPARQPKLWLLDRDGCINQDVGAPGVVRVDDLALIPGSAGAIRRLRLLGPVAIVTNQSCRGLGLLSTEGLQDIHKQLRHLLATTARGGRASREQWDAMYICEDAVNSPRKKPEPGLILEACKDFEVDPSEALMIGDSWSDVVAAQRAGCVGVLVATGHGESLSKALAKHGVDLPTTLTAEVFTARETAEHDAPCLVEWIKGRSESEAALIWEAMQAAPAVRFYRDLAQAVDELTEPSAQPVETGKYSDDEPWCCPPV